MELTYATIAVLASMIFVLAGMVGYLYWQQTHMLQHLQSLAMALATHVEQVRQLQYQPEPEPQPQVQSAPQPDKEEEEDDRVSVEHVEGPPPAKNTTPTATSAVDDSVDDLQDKTASELREMLTKKGIPFGKRDSKSVLIQLLLATS